MIPYINAASDKVSRFVHINPEAVPREELLELCDTFCPLLGGQRDQVLLTLLLLLLHQHPDLLSDRPEVIREVTVVGRPNLGYDMKSASWLSPWPEEAPQQSPLSKRPARRPQDDKVGDITRS